MHPLRERNVSAVAVMDEQTEESLEHVKILQMTGKHFVVLIKVEKWHAQHYIEALDSKK